MILTEFQLWFPNFWGSNFLFKSKWGILNSDSMLLQKLTFLPSMSLKFYSWDSSVKLFLHRPAPHPISNHTQFPIIVWAISYCSVVSLSPSMDTALLLYSPSHHQHNAVTDSRFLGVSGGNGRGEVKKGMEGYVKNLTLKIRRHSFQSSLPVSHLLPLQG